MIHPRLDRSRLVERRATGFTLLELVVASSILVGIVGAAWACLVAGLDRRDDVAERMDLLQSARATLKLLTDDLKVACPLSGDAEFVGMDRTIDDVEADNLDFATHRWTPSRAGEADLCEVSWFVARDPRSGGFTLYRRRDPTPDDRPFEGGSRERILGGVRRFQLEYYDGFVWYDSWGPEVDASSTTRPERIDPSSPWAELGNDEGLPEAVRVTLSLDPDTDIVVAGSPAATKRVDQGSGAGDEGTQAAAITVRTVVRLELASRANSISFSGSSTDAAGSSVVESTPTTGEGGDAAPADGSGGER